MSNLIQNIERIIHDSMKNNHIPGAAVTVINDREVILSKGFGKTTVEQWGSPVRPDTLFRIASVSKLFTGTVLMMLAEKGLIDLDLPVQQYIPWFSAGDKERSKLITTRMLLTHTSGLPTGDDVRSRYQEDGLLRYMKEVVPTLPILFHPGSAYTYGNHALNIAGFVAEQVTNTPFPKIVQEMLFDKLEMSQTTYDPLKAMTYPFALPHKKDTKGNLHVSHQVYDTVASYPSYFAFSSIEDLSKFAMLHLQNGAYAGSQLLSLSSVNEMRRLQSKWYNLTEGGCGITFFRETKDAIERFWHYGQYSNQYSSQFILIPEKGIAVIALANGENIFQAGYEIVDELLKDHASAETINDLPYVGTRLPLYEGTFLHSYYGLFEIKKNDGDSVLMKHNEQEFNLQPYNADTYLAKDQDGNIVFTVGFPVQNEGNTNKCIVVNSKACPEFQSETPTSPATWEEWTGQYSDGVETFDVRIQSDSLIIKDLQSNLDLVGKPINKNQFLTKEYGLVSFIEVSGVINLEFDFAWRYPKQKNAVLS